MQSLAIPDTGFWRDEFPEATGNGERPYLFKRMLRPEFDVAGEIARVVRQLQDGRSSGQARIRVYVEEDRRNDIASSLLTEILLADETIVEYMQRVTQSQRFSLIINNLERVSELLAAFLGQFLQSMFSVRGVPIGGSEQVAFVGNYSGTAFGVHEGYEHAFLCHFGPGTKFFYCLSRETYMQLTDGKREPTFGDYSHMLEHAEKFIMKPGDVLYLPALVYHVGRQDEFSVSVAVPLYTYPFTRYLRLAIVPGLAASLPFDQEGTSHLLSHSANVDESISELLSFSTTVLENWRSTSVAKILNYHWLRLLSNGGWETESMYVENPFLEAQDWTDERTNDENRSEIFRLKQPYRIYFRQDIDCGPDELRLFLRGQTIRTSYFLGCEALIEKINSYSQIDKPADQNALLLLQKLLRTGALESIGEN